MNSAQSYRSEVSFIRDLRTFTRWGESVYVQITALYFDGDPIWAMRRNSEDPGGTVCICPLISVYLANKLVFGPDQYCATSGLAKSHLVHLPRKTKPTGIILFNSTLSWNVRTILPLKVTWYRSVCITVRISQRCFNSLAKRYMYHNINPLNPNFWYIYSGSHYSPCN